MTRASRILSCACPQWTVLKVIHLLSVETAATATLFLTVFYWIALASGPVTADNIMKHGANNGVALGDVLLSRVPFVSYHFQVFAVPTLIREGLQHPVCAIYEGCMSYSSEGAQPLYTRKSRGRAGLETDCGCLSRALTIGACAASHRWCSCTVRCT